MLVNTELFRLYCQNIFPCMICLLFIFLIFEMSFLMTFGFCFICFYHLRVRLLVIFDWCFLPLSNVNVIIFHCNQLQHSVFFPTTNDILLFDTPYSTISTISSQSKMIDVFFSYYSQFDSSDLSL